MVNFEPPLPKSRPEAELFRLLSEIPADSEGMQRAADLISEHERQLVEDQQALADWVSALEADDSAEAREALARFRGYPGEAGADGSPEAEPGEPSAVAAAPVKAKPEAAGRASFESLLTGSTPVIAEAKNVDQVPRRRANLLELVYLPLALSLLAFTLEISATQALVLSASLALGALLCLLAARGGLTLAGQLGNVALGVTLGRLVAALLLVTSMWLLAPLALTGAAEPELTADLEGATLYFALGLLASMLMLSMVRTTVIARLLSLVPVLALLWLGLNGEFLEISLDSLRMADFGYAGIAILIGFVIQSQALPLARPQRYVFSALLVIPATAAALVSSAMVLAPADQALGLLAACALACYALGREAVASSQRAKVNPLLALVLLAAVALAAVLFASELEISHWLVAATLGFVGVISSDAILRSQSVHQASTEQPFGFYGALSASALGVWLLSALVGIAGLGLSGVLEFGLPVVFDAPLLSLESLAVLVLVAATLFGMMRFAVVKARELDQIAARGDASLENLLGL